VGEDVAGAAGVHRRSWGLLERQRAKRAELIKPHAFTELAAVIAVVCTSTRAWRPPHGVEVGALNL
jgi:hypothetical protein